MRATLAAILVVIGMALNAANAQAVPVSPSSMTSLPPATASPPPNLQNHPNPTEPSQSNRVQVLGDTPSVATSPMKSETFLRVLEILGVWLGAIATLAAVAVALFLQQFLERRRRPKVEVLYHVNSPADNRYLPPATDPSGPGDNRHELWLRLRVRNSGRFPANDVELKMIGLRVGKDSAQQNRPSWSFKVSSLDAMRSTIHPSFPQYYDIAFVVYDINTLKLHAHLVLTTEPAAHWSKQKGKIESSQAYTGLKIGCPYEIFFAVVGSNLDARYYRMPVQITPLGDGSQVESNLRQCVIAAAPIEIAPEEAFETPSKAL